MKMSDVSHIFFLWMKIVEQIYGLPGMNKEACMLVRQCLDWTGLSGGGISVIFWVVKAAKNRFYF